MERSLTYFFAYDAVNEAAYTARTREEIIAAADKIRCSHFSELRDGETYPVALYRKNDKGAWIRTPGKAPPASVDPLTAWKT